MRYPVSIHALLTRSNQSIGDSKREGFLIIEGMIALATVVIFSLVIMTIRTNITIWHTQAQQYLQAVSLADRIFERMSMHQEIPDTVGKFGIKTFIKADEKIPYKHIQVTIQWKSARNEEKELSFFGGMVDAA